MIHKQVQMQLDHLKCWVDNEKEMEERCKKSNISYNPSRRKWENIEQYEAYKKEVEQNGDKNLLVKIRMKGEGGISMYGVYPFARRYIHPRELLVYRTKHGAEVLLKEDDVEIIRE